MGRKRKRHSQGWVFLDKRSTPQRWIAHWYFGEVYRDKKGVLRYRQGTHFLGLKSKDDLPTKSAALKKWEGQREDIVNSTRATLPVKPLDPTFQYFLNEEFIPLRKGRWNNATRAKVSYFF